MSIEKIHLDIHRILTLLPHRCLILLVDRALEKIYENVVIGNFLYALGFAIRARQSVQSMPRVIHLLQQAQGFCVKRLAWIKRVAHTTGHD